MRYFKSLGVLLLLVAACVLLALGAMAIGQTGAEVSRSASKTAPAPESVPTLQSAVDDEAPAGQSVPAVQSTDNIAVSGSEQGPVEQSAVNTAISFGTRTRAEADPLQNVSDLTKAIAGQLQSGDQYLEVQTRRLAEQFAQAKDDESRAKLKGELAKAIERHFDVRHEIRKREIEQLEAQVKKLREHLAKRGEARQSIVQMRLGQFISAAEGLGWDADLGGGRVRQGRWSSSGPAASYDALMRTMSNEVGRQQALEEVLKNAPASQARQSGSIDLAPTATPIEAPRR
jgi:hypothetical protein